MTNPAFTGYLEDPYLQDPPDYLGGTATDHFGLQVNLITNGLAENGVQTNRTIPDNKKEVGLQVERAIGASAFSGVQVNMINTKAKENGLQVHRQVIDFMKSTGFEIRRDKSFPHLLCEELGYLEGPYLEGGYLVRGYCVPGPLQVARTILVKKENGLQIHRTIDSTKSIGTQISRTINAQKPFGLQVELIRALSMAIQIRQVLYNTTNLRVMVEFPSRGAKVTGGGNNLMGNPKGTGKNWSSTSTAAGDFSPFNLNTDIVEQRFQTAAAFSATLICDTEVAQGTGVDTLAILEHNLTSSATVVIEGSNDSGFAPVGQTITPTWTEQNIWYIAPTYPTTQFRYWRFNISDPTNSDPDGIKIGTIVFGVTTILQGECFVDEVKRRQKHFVDRVPTAGFTNVSNDRALKTAVGLEFRNIRYNRGNYKNLKEIFEFARTSFKCLWIPDPTDPPRFGLFAKMVQIPDETHRNLGSGTDADRVDFSLEIDESL